MDSLSFKQISERLKQIDFPEINLGIGIGSDGIPPPAFVALYLKADPRVMTLNYRDENNNPQYETPVILHKPLWKLDGKRILLVDDVSVSGKTMNAALEQLKGYNMKTLAMKDTADFVLFPDIKDCVKWPWKE